MAKSPAWQRKEGKSPTGGLNAKGRASAKKQEMNLNHLSQKADHARNHFAPAWKATRRKIPVQKRLRILIAESTNL